MSWVARINVGEHVYWVSLCRGDHTRPQEEVCQEKRILTNQYFKVFFFLLWEFPPVYVILDGKPECVTLYIRLADVEKNEHWQISMMAEMRASLAGIVYILWIQSFWACIRHKRFFPLHIGNDMWYSQVFCDTGKSSQLLLDLRCISWRRNFMVFRSWVRHCFCLHPHETTVSPVGLYFGGFLVFFATYVELVIFGVCMATMIKTWRGHSYFKE